MKPNTTIKPDDFCKGCQWEDKNNGDRRLCICMDCPREKEDNDYR